MSAANPILTLQQRIVDLLEANAYFTGLSATKQLLTEKIADLEYQIENSLLPLGFGVIVTTATGKSVEADCGKLLYQLPGAALRL